MRAFADAHSEEIWEETRKRVDRHLTTRDDHWNPVKSLTDLSRKVAQEYEGRFLIELLQNAYDAHAKGSRGGRVSIHLDTTEGEHGVLYVTNTGIPFDRTNFDALSNIANSSKPPGEGIGNKGIGFRSVLQVCEYPEVYSCDPLRDMDSDFSGYSFTFARDEDLRALAGSSDEYEILVEEFSRYLLPVPMAPPRAVIDRFGGSAATVIRLQLRSETAAATALDQLRRLADASAPVMLFLPRLDTITISVSPEEESSPVVLTRVESPFALQLELVGTELHVVETASRSFLVATSHIGKHTSEKRSRRASRRRGSTPRGATGAGTPRWESQSASRLTTWSRSPTPSFRCKSLHRSTATSTPLFTRGSRVRTSMRPCRSTTCSSMSPRRRRCEWPLR